MNHEEENERETAQGDGSIREKEPVVSPEENRWHLARCGTAAPAAAPETYPMAVRAIQGPFPNGSTR